MAIKITNPDVQSLPENAELAGGSFELYESGSGKRRFASTEPSLFNAAPFQNALNAKGWPIQHLWLDAVDGVDTLFRDRQGNTLYRTPLASAMASLNPDSYSTKVLALLAAGEEPGTPPAAISDLDAELDGTTATLTWTANGGTVSIYRRNVTVNGKYALIESGIAGNATSYEDAGLSLASTYEWVIRSSNADGFSPASNVATVTTAGAVPAPSPISDLAVSSTTPSQATLTWTANGGTIALYRRNVTLLGPFTLVNDAISGAATSYTDTGLTPNTLYEWRVIASNASGVSAPSNIASGKTADGTPAYQYMQPQQDKRGVWSLNDDRYGPPDTSDDSFFLADPDYTFVDDFSGANDASFWEATGISVEYGADNPDGPGKCLLFRALAADGAADGHNWTEQKFFLPVDAAQIEIQYDIWVSPGFEIQPGGTSHQKFLLLWSGEYGTAASNCSINCEVWPNHKIGFNWGEDGINYGHAIPSAPEPFLTPGGGYWMRVHFFINLAESEEGKGRIIMLKDGSVYSDTANTQYADHNWDTQPAYATRGNYLNSGYLMGWQNQPYLVDTYFAVRNFQLRANTTHKAVNYGVAGE